MAINVSVRCNKAINVSVRCNKAINVSVRCNSGFLPDMILLTLCHYHRGTQLNAMKSFCLCNL